MPSCTCARESSASAVRRSKYRVFALRWGFMALVPGSFLIFTIGADTFWSAMQAAYAARNDAQPNVYSSQYKHRLPGE